MKELNIISSNIKLHKISIHILFFCMCFLSYQIYKDNNRLNEQKRLLIAQQEQINKLILNAEYNKLRYEKKVR